MSLYTTCVLVLVMARCGGGVRVYSMMPGYRITSPILSSPSCDRSCKRTCICACGCEPDCKSVTVSQQSQACHLHQNYIYDEDTEFTASGDWEYHQVTADTVTKGDWTLVFRVTPRNGQSAYSTWHDTGNHDDNPAVNYDTPPGCATTNSSKSCDRNFRSKILDNWTTYGITEVKLEMFQNGEPKHHVIFNGTGCNMSSWMSPDRILSSTWTDLIGNTFNYFSIIGHNDRTFFISKSYDGCENDYAWMIVTDRPAGHGCPYEAQFTAVPGILFSPGPTVGNIQDDFVEADVMAVFVKLS